MLQDIQHLQSVAPQRHRSTRLPTLVVVELLAGHQAAGSPFVIVAAQLGSALQPGPSLFALQWVQGSPAFAESGSSQHHLLQSSMQTS